MACADCNEPAALYRLEHTQTKNPKPWDELYPPIRVKWRKKYIKQKELL